MTDEKKVGSAYAPTLSRWQKGQSGNPKGRPKSKSEMVQDAARILNQPIEARMPDGRTVKLDGFEAAYFALCKKGLKGHKVFLLAAIRTMLEVGPIVQAEEERERTSKQRVLDAFRKMGIEVPELPE